MRFLKVTEFQQQDCFNQLSDSPFLNYLPYAAPAHVKITVQNRPVICPVMTFTTSSKGKNLWQCKGYKSRKIIAIIYKSSCKVTRTG